MGYNLSEITDAQLQFLRDQKDEELRQIYEEDQDVMIDSDEEGPKDLD